MFRYFTFLYFLIRLIVYLFKCLDVIKYTLVQERSLLETRCHKTRDPSCADLREGPFLENFTKDQYKKNTEMNVQMPFSGPCFQNCCPGPYFLNFLVPPLPIHIQYEQWLFIGTSFFSHDFSIYVSWVFFQSSLP